MESYARGPELPLLDGTLWDVFAHTAARFPSRDAVVSRHQGQRLTFSALLADAERAAAGLAALGVGPGDRFGMWATSCVEWVILQLAATRSGAILVNVNPAYRSNELAYAIRKSRMKAIFLHARDRRCDYAGILAGASPGDLRAVYLGGPDWSAFMAERAAAPPARGADEVTNIQFTSGTTGSPKGVLLTHRNVVNNGAFVARMLRADEHDRIALPVPMYHCFGCVGGTIVMAVTGAAIVMPAATFDPLETLRAIEAEHATILYGVPAMFIAQLNHPEFSSFNLRSLRGGIMSGAPCPVEVMNRVTRDMHCDEMTIMYGQTEASPVITGSAVDDPIEMRVSTVGRAYPNTEVKIVDPAGHTVPAGTQGELCTRGYLVMKGYDGDDAATARAVDADGWLHTGDLATMREDGCFRITGRMTDMIIRGGENIYPREVEEFLFTHPAVAEAHVFGVPDECLGEVVAAWVKTRGPDALTADDLREFCRNKIAHFKIPKYVRFVDAFPMTVSGKAQKFRMREVEVAERGLAAAAAVETA